MSQGSTPSPPSITSSRSELGAGFIAHYFGIEQCAPYANLEKNPDGQRIASQTYSEPLSSPLYLAVGRDFEQKQLHALASQAKRVYGPTTQHYYLPDGPGSTGEWADDYLTATVEFLELVQEVAADPVGASPSVAWQAKLIGQIGDWPVKGKSDLLALVPGGPGDDYDVLIYILEAKSSITQRTAHRVQATVYAELIEQAISGLNIDVALEGSIVNPENSLTSTWLPDLETFEFDTMSATLTAALEADGALTAAIDGDYEEMPRRLAPRCASCPHEQVCLTHELQSDGLGLGLLQLDEGLQETLADIGITSLEDLAMLIDLSTVNRYGEVDEWEDIPFAAGAGPWVETIRERTNISNLRQLCVGAARFVDEVDPSEPGQWPAAIQGSGYGLPADDPSHIGDTQYPPDSLIKVFVTVVPDTVRDCVAALAARVISSEGTDTVVAYPQRFSRTSPQLENQEQSLLVRFFRELGQTIERLAPDISSEFNPRDGAVFYDDDEGFPHLYFFDEHQREALMDAVRRHESVRSARAVRSLLGLRSAIAEHDTTNLPDQEMVSVLSKEFRQRFAMRFIGLGLVQTVAQFWDTDDGWFGWDTAPYGQYGGEPSLTEIFAADLFEVEVDYTPTGDAVQFHHTSTPDAITGDAQGQFGSSYPLANRHTTTLPVAYIWAEHDELTPAMADTAQQKAAIQRYRWRTSSRNQRITEQDIRTILERMTAALAHLERAIEVPANDSRWPDAGKDAKVPKAPLDTSQLTSIQQGTGTLASTVQEYALLEHDTGEKGAIYKYRRPLDERVESGHSMLLEATSAWEDDTGRYTDYYLEADIVDPTDIGVGGDADRTIPRSIQEGDWKVITEVDPTESPPRIRELGDRKRFLRSTVVKVENINETTGSVRLNCMDTSSWLRSDDPCVTSHRDPEVIDGQARSPNPTPAPDYVTTYLQAGRMYVLDEFADDYNKMRAFRALAAAENGVPGNTGNSLYDHINDLYTR